MTAISDGLPSVRAIREALEEVPGALREEPLPEHAGSGECPASAIWISDPERGRGMEMRDAPNTSAEDSDNGFVDEPALIFEVPPVVTDSDIERVLGEDRIRELERLQQIRGIDALGWYVTFHQRKYQHGVHIPVEGVLMPAWQSFYKVGMPVERKLELAFHAILRHELLHFEADCMTANWELTTGVSVHWDSRVHHRNVNGYVELEEGLANAYMLRGFKHPARILANSAGAYRALKSFCAQQPTGYDWGPKYAISRGAYIGGCRDLADDYHQTSAATWHVPHAFDTLMLYPNPIRIDWTRCPILILDEHDLLAQLGTGISYFEMVEHVEETAAFQRSLRKLDNRLRKTWESTKYDLARSTALKSLDFKQWKKGGRDVYSVRVGGNYRAHLQYDRATTTWFAEEIGDHKEMGHG